MAEKCPLGIKALWVDDDKAIAGIGKTWLEMMGYEAYSAENGEEALKIMNSAFFPIVITDIFMPIMNGYDLIQEIRRRHGSKCFIVVVSGSDDYIKTIKGFDLIDASMAKPVDLSALKEVLKKAS